jgi:hypothetical protein
MGPFCRANRARIMRRVYHGPKCRFPGAAQHHKRVNALMALHRIRETSAGKTKISGRLITAPKFSLMNRTA